MKSKTHITQDVLKCTLAKGFDKVSRWKSVLPHTFLTTKNKFLRTRSELDSVRIVGEGALSDWVQLYMRWITYLRGKWQIWWFYPAQYCCRKPSQL